MKSLAARGSNWKCAGASTRNAVRRMKEECGQSRASSVYFDPHPPPIVYADADLSDNWGMAASGLPEMLRIWPYK